MSDPSQNTIQRAVSNGGAFPIPWGSAFPKRVSLLSSFDSSLAVNGNPFSVQSPFVARNPFIANDETEFVLDCSGRTAGSGAFREVVTSGSKSTTEHLSVGMGITVGCSFLSASVSGSYDRTVTGNSDYHKKSQHSHYRGPLINCAKLPDFTDDARALLQENPKEFRRRYGDYFVKAVQLGGESALMVSQSASTTTTVDAYSVTVTVKILFIKAKKTWSGQFISSLSDRTLSLTCFDTVTSSHVSHAVNAQSPEWVIADLAAMLEEYDDYASNLQGRVTDRLDQLLGKGWKEGMPISEAAVGELVKSGLVVELVLAPYETVRDFVEYKPRPVESEVALSLVLPAE